MGMRIKAATSRDLARRDSFTLDGRTRAHNTRLAAGHHFILRRYPMNTQPTQEGKNAMSRARTWIAVLAIGQLAACSSTLTQISPTQPAGAPTGRAGPFLNSPFFITVIGGVVVAAITTGYGYLKAHNDQKLARDSARREKQTAVLSSVANDLPIYISTMASMRQLKVWLEANPASDAKDEVGRPRDEVLKEYTEFFKLYLKTRGSLSILTEVDSFYETEQVCSLVNEVDLAIDKIHDAKDRPARLEAMKAEERVFDSLLSAMAAEIRGAHRNEDVQGPRLGRCLHPSPSKN